MTTTISSYLSFEDTAREAMEFYQSVLGGELVLTTFAQLQASEDPAEDHRIMHSVLTTPSGQVFMASDTPSSMEYTPPAGHSLFISGEDEQELRGYWDALSETVVVPLAPSPWGDSFGMCRDRFGIDWMVNIVVTAPGEEPADAPASSSASPVDTSGDAVGVQSGPAHGEEDQRRRPSPRDTATRPA